MTTDTRRSGGAAALKGSWEALHAEALALSRQGNDEALTRYGRLIDRLTALPEARRAAQDQRLQSILDQSVLGLQSHYARRNRLDEMAAIDEGVFEILSDDAKSLWRENQARAYWWLGRPQEAAEIIRTESEDLPFDVELRWLLFSILLDDGRIDDADGVRRSLLTELQSLFRAQGLSESLVEDVDAQMMVKERLAGGSETNQISVQFGLLHFLRSCVDLEKRRWQDAADAFGMAARVSDAYSDLWHLLYRPLALNNQGRLAQRALNREDSPVSQGFWRGLSGFYAGDRQGAATEWRRVTQIPLEEVTLSSVGDWILAHYYLHAVQIPYTPEGSNATPPETVSVDQGEDQDGGNVSDEVRQGLHVALNLLGQQKTRRDPLVLGLAALGWGMNGHKEHLHRNLRHAVELLRASLQDNKLSVFNWYFFRDLLPTEVFAEVESYFHAPRYLQGEADGE
ncbi:MAG: hypothetical protein F4148_04785 [Caldilineaceae bacterium SB0675_bin_29]|uniref:Tetratricopeptide repeat protein n=1 Tax=Caldilineaceae bacterium SB0675_bin_29 TaxID=2605266 RepID=A0A6B1FTY1_9CHLR|nr:hypothetical protein [Caldilineaceae bacterium SB0675_bin_29]